MTAAQIKHTCYFSIYSAIQCRQSGLLNTSFEYKADHAAAVQKKMALSREQSVCWGDWFIAKADIQSSEVQNLWLLTQMIQAIPAFLNLFLNSLCLHLHN